MVGKGGAVLLCDSQASTRASEFHGLQKQFPGDDCLIGATGSVDITDALFSYFIRVVEAGTGINAASINKLISDFVTTELLPAAREEVEFLVATEKSILHFKPSTFMHARRRGSFASVGSGAEFVFRARGRDAALGIVRGQDSLADTLIAAEGYLGVANESLTVDDVLLLGIVTNGRSYMLGDKSITLQYFHAPIQPVWADAAKRFDGIMALATTLRSEVRESLRRFSVIYTGGFDAEAARAVVDASDSIRRLRVQLEGELQSYLHWYDGHLGRVAPPPTVAPGP